ncbi:MAG: hypothetical protein Q7T89_14115 [Anaerolineales bacterium]|nr:hypothetical protein [Anaerolineales bacterium]
MKTPVAFIIFNRPDTTARVFEEIRRAKPPKLLIIADGPRLNRPSEAERVTATRAIVERVDWQCEVLENYSDINLGCKRRVSSGLDWVFETVEEAIILEDDCLPHPTFFRFCEELLEKYRDDERVMHISGDNFQFGRKRSEASYYFSRYAHVWGWASWRRAWQYYDVQMKQWADIETKERFLRDFANMAEKRFWKAKWNGVLAGKIDTWDFQWAFACMARKSLSIAPNINLVSNIGFGAASTNTSRVSLLADIPTAAMEFPLVPPGLFTKDIDADENVANLFFSPSLIRLMVGQIRLWVHWMYRRLV